MLRMDDISSIEWKNKSFSDTKSAPNDWQINNRGMLLEREKQMFEMDDISSLNKYAVS